MTDRTGGTGGTAHEELCARTSERLALDPSTTYREACRRTGELMGEILRAPVMVRFTSMNGAPFSGATVRLADGSYVVYCAASRSWYHRLGILLHELAHVLLGHEPASLEGVRRQFLPHLPGKMARIVAARGAHTGEQEQEAEELADLLLARLTESPGRPAGALPPQAPARLRRIAEELSHLR